MEICAYSKFVGIDTSTDRFDQPQIEFLYLNNYIVNKHLHTLSKRFGSNYDTHTGDIWGIGGYAVSDVLPRKALTVTPIRHRFDTPTHYIEKYNWGTGAWTAMTLGASTSFGVSDIATFAQIGELLCIAGGTPAKVTGLTADVTRLGGSGPGVAPTLGAIAGTLTGNYRWLYTFYDSTSGWESSPSLATDLVTLAGAGRRLTMGTTADREGVDKKRIYRTTASGEDPLLLVTTINLATTTYDDNGTVTDANLGDLAPTAEDHDAPPSTCYLAYSYEQRLWLADENILYWSKPYDGTNASLEYFSPNRSLTFDFRITGIIATESGRLYILLPPGFGIYELIGRSFDDPNNLPELTIRYPKEGTYFPQSVCSNRENIAFWGPQGPRILTPGGVDIRVEEAIRNSIRDANISTYDDNVFVWGSWHEASNQFLFGYSGQAAGVVTWEDTSSLAPVLWEDVNTLSNVDWEETP